MHLVAVAHSILTPEDKAAAFATILGVMPSEARAHSLVPLPRAVASRAVSETRVARCRAAPRRRPGLVVVSADQVIGDSRRFLARTFVVTDESSSRTRKDGAQAQLAWGDIVAVVAACGSRTCRRVIRRRRRRRRPVRPRERHALRRHQPRRRRRACQRARAGARACARSDQRARGRSLDETGHASRSCSAGSPPSPTPTTGRLVAVRARDARLSLAVTAIRSANVFCAPHAQRGGRWGDPRGCGSRR